MAAAASAQADSALRVSQLLQAGAFDRLAPLLDALELQVSPVGAVATALLEITAGRGARPQRRRRWLSTDPPR